MTGQKWQSRTSDAPEEKKSRLSPQRKRILLQLGICLFMLAAGWTSVGWMVSDITGEYTSRETALGIVHLSIVRKATTIKTELTYGYNNVFAGTQPSTDSGSEVNWTFSVPDEWLQRGRPNREVHFIGKVEDGVVRGVIKDGPGRYPVKLERDMITSIFRQLESHLPWVS